MYATELLKIWQRQNINVKAFGIGSVDMEKQGFEIIGRSEELAVMGLQEIISHWPLIKKTFHQLVAEAEVRRPDVVLLMDYPEFNLRLAKKLKNLGLPIVYYISPQIWAWRTYRVHKIKELVDLMLVLFPFEKEFYAKYGVPSEFVGHPLIDSLEELTPSEKEIQQTRLDLLGGSYKHLLGLMPGSRKSEIKHNLETQIRTANQVHKMNPEVLPVLFVAPSLDEKFLEELSQKYNFTGKIIKKDPFYMISLADTILCASGTATLMVGLCEKPMVVMYKMKPLTAFFAKRLVTHVPYFAMVNLVSQKEIVPERFQEKANVKELSKLLVQLIYNESGKREQTLIELKKLKERLGRNGGINNLSEQILNFVKSRAK